MKYVRYKNLKTGEIFEPKRKVSLPNDLNDDEIISAYHDAVKAEQLQYDEFCKKADIRDKIISSFKELYGWNDSEVDFRRQFTDFEQYLNKWVEYYYEHPEEEI